MAEQSLTAKRRVARTHNFALLGNPGTGKTTVGKLIAQFLHELGVRPSKNVETTTGEKLSRMGAGEVEKLINRANGGTLFIDEAYALRPAANGDAASVAMQLLDAADEWRETLTIVLAGYKDDMDTELFYWNEGFPRRFSHTITFDDYTEAELAQIFALRCEEHDWPPETPDVVSLAARRVARGRNNKGFGNAGAVQMLFESATARALSRDNNALSITTVDIIGPRPARATLPDLDSALKELEGMTGLKSVKEAITELVGLAERNYDSELEGKAPNPIPLNRVFLGNPGTGKTTVAKIYGRVLKVGARVFTPFTAELPLTYVYHAPLSTRVIPHANEHIIFYCVTPAASLINAVGASLMHGFSCRPPGSSPTAATSWCNPIA